MEKVAGPAPATAAPDAAAPKASIAQAAKMAVQKASAVSTPSRPGRAAVNHTSGWQQPPKTAHPPKGVPRVAVDLAVQRAGKDGPGLYVVELENKRGHHVLIAIKDGQVATHGGCVQSSRTVSYAKLHAAIYQIPVNASLASKEVQKLVK